MWLLRVLPVAAGRWGLGNIRVVIGSRPFLFAVVLRLAADAVLEDARESLRAARVFRVSQRVGQSSPKFAVRVVVNRRWRRGEVNAD